ncbi:MAG: hypothetical protein ACKN86_13615 [Crocinitomicaceae bacterium]
MTMQELIEVKYSGQVDQTMDYAKVAVQTIAVLIGGLVIWRAVIAYQHRQRISRRQNSYFETKYSKHWKK